MTLYEKLKDTNKLNRFISSYPATGTEIEDILKKEMYFHNLRVRDLMTLQDIYNVGLDLHELKNLFK